jgi:hypothetical protein
MKAFLLTCWHGKWSCGWEQWDGKPQFEFFSTYYDGLIYCLHIGPLWIEVDE